MSDKLHPLTYIRVTKKLCKLIGEQPEHNTFYWVKEVDIDYNDWQVIIYYLEIMLPQLEDITILPLTQLSLLIMIASTHTDSDHIWYALGNNDNYLHTSYRDSFIHMSDLDTVLCKNYDINMWPHSD